jgi:hypothetical protein
MTFKAIVLMQPLLSQSGQMTGSGWLVGAGILFTLHCLIGLGAALVAQQKGLSFRRWIWVGLLGGSIALIAILRHSESVAESAAQSTAEPR